jgi:hypothetical protein
MKIFKVEMILAGVIDGSMAVYYGVMTRIDVASGQ